MLFFDNASTTQAFKEVADRVAYFLTDAYFNPSALYNEGANVKSLIEQARQTIANQLCVQKNEIIFTSCATESNNWVLNSAIKSKKDNIVTTFGEHASVFECASRLKAKNLDVRFAGLNPDSSVNIPDLLDKIDQNTTLVSLIHCSNETGVINDIAKIVKQIRSINPNTLIHCDGVQAFCKIDTNLRHLDVDFYTISAHKIGGTKGIGALYVNKKRRIQPIIVGGGQEGGLRSGTENTAGIVGFGEAVECFGRYYDRQRVREIFEFLTADMTQNGWIFNGASGGVGQNSGFIMSFSFEGIRAEVLQHMLSDQGILIGLGSACSSKSNENRVLGAMGRTKSQVLGNIRLSISLNTTLDEAKTVAKAIQSTLQSLKSNLSINNRD